jgi:hypothetical protein
MRYIGPLSFEERYAYEQFRKAEKDGQTAKSSISKDPKRRCLRVGIDGCEWHGTLPRPRDDGGRKSLLLVVAVHTLLRGIEP